MPLVVQGVSSARTLSQIGELCGDPTPLAIAEGAYRFASDGGRFAAIAAWCDEQRIDCALVPDGLALADFGLVVMDMDSTLVSSETIDELADLRGVKPQVAAITARAMRGELDFAQSLRQRVALLEGEAESSLHTVYEQRIKLNPGAEALLAGLRELGIKTMLLSGGFTFFTERLKDRLGLDYAESNTLEIIDGQLTGHVLGDIVDADAKARHLLRVRDQLGLAPEQVIAIGDGANDLKMLAAAGCGIAYHAKPIVRAQAHFAINHVGLDGVLNMFS
jgi:phosphoserine phosphatase